MPGHWITVGGHTMQTVDIDTVIALLRSMQNDKQGVSKALDQLLDMKLEDRTITPLEADTTYAVTVTARTDCD